MPSLGTAFGARMEVAGYRTEAGDVVSAQFRIAPDGEAEPAVAAIAEADTSTGEWLNQRQAAAHLGLAYSTFRKIAWRIPRHRFTKKFHRDVLADPSKWRKETARPDHEKRRKGRKPQPK